MKKGLIVLLVIGIIVLFGGCQFVKVQNNLVTQDEQVKNAWGSVQSAYQRRADLIPSLVATVKGAADFEKSTYVQVAQARAGELKQATNVDPNSLDAQKFAEIQKANAAAQESAKMMLNIMVERYPDLKANQNFLSLQDQLEGTENRINTERNKFNDAVNQFNVSVRQFPGSLFASMLGYKVKTLFEADKGAEKAPKVQF